MHATYEGTLNIAGDEISGTFTQGAALPLSFHRVEKIEELKRPQASAKPYPYNEEAVAYENKAAAVKLAGTLTTPAPAARSQPYPC